MESRTVTREEVLNFLSIQNYGNGYGNGCCSGDGDACGCGYGCDPDDGEGYGSGYSDGYGYGCNAGDGEIDGEGYGYGSGDGSSSGHGYENCDGVGYGDSYDFVSENILSLNGNIVDYIDMIPTIITQVHGNNACGYIVNIDLTLESCYIARVVNSFAHGKTLKDAVAEAEAKELEKIPIEVRIGKFKEIFGTLDSEHTGREFYDWHHILTGSCRMGRDSFCKTNGIDLGKKYTVRYFLDITKNSYKGDIIRKIKEAYRNA